MLLFVTGIPNTSEVEDIACLFQTFGSFTILSLKSLKDQTKIVAANPQPNLRRGFCIMEAHDLDSFRSVIEMETLCIGKHSLKVTEFLHGTALERFMQVEESRRVIIKRVPRAFHMERLVCALEGSFGKIRRIFSYEAPDRAKKPKATTAKFGSYSVEFETTESAGKAAESRTLTLPAELGGQFFLEAFKRRNDVKFKDVTYMDRLLPDSPAPKPTMVSQVPKEASLKSPGFLPELLPEPDKSEPNPLWQSSWVIESLLHNEKPSSAYYFTVRELFGVKSLSASQKAVHSSPEVRFNVNLLPQSRNPAPRFH